MPTGFAGCLLEWVWDAKCKWYGGLGKIYMALKQTGEEGIETWKEWSDGLGWYGLGWWEAGWIL
jgi:hypothetical protein